MFVPRPRLWKSSPHRVVGCSPAACDTRIQPSPTCRGREMWNHSAGLLARAFCGGWATFACGASGPFRGESGIYTPMRLFGASGCEEYASGVLAGPRGKPEIWSWAICRIDWKFSRPHATFAGKT